MWGSLQGYLEDGSRFGWNIGYGFGNTSAASENMLFYNGKSHKLDEVTFNIPVKNGKDDYMSPWTFTSNDGRFEMNFTPILDRQAPLNVGEVVFAAEELRQQALAGGVALERLLGGVFVQLEGDDEVGQMSDACAECLRA